MGTGSTWSGPSASTRDTQFAEIHIGDQDLPAKNGHLDWRASLNFDSLEATVRNLSQLGRRVSIALALCSQLYLGTVVRPPAPARA